MTRLDEFYTSRVESSHYKSRVESSQCINSTRLDSFGALIETNEFWSGPLPLIKMYENCNFNDKYIVPEQKYNGM